MSAINTSFFSLQRSNLHSRTTVKLSPLWAWKSKVHFKLSLERHFGICIMFTSYQFYDFKEGLEAICSQINTVARIREKMHSFRNICTLSIIFYSFILFRRSHPFSARFWLRVWNWIPCKTSGGIFVSSAHRPSRIIPAQRTRFGLKVSFSKMD